MTTMLKQLASKIEKAVEANHPPNGKPMPTQPTPTPRLDGDEGLSVTLTLRQRTRKE